MVIDQAQVMLWLGHFLWPFLRITGLFLTAPVYGSAMIPGVVKSVLAATFAFCLALWLPNLPAFPGDPLTAIFTGVSQIAFGAMLGMIMQIVIAAVASAGEIAGLAMGLSFAEMQFREASGTTPVLYNIMLWAGMLGYLAAGGPLWLFAAIAHSFQNGVGVAPIASWADIAGLGGNLISAAVLLALPVVAVSLCVNLTVGLTAVFAPQMNLLTIGFPLLILTGLWVLAGSVFYLPNILHHLIALGMNAITLILTHD
jgi:flagellar biosynthetic protein FliR